jgi:cyclic beta-1,2-glucan synthetase
MVRTLSRPATILETCARALRAVRAAHPSPAATPDARRLDPTDDQQFEESLPGALGWLSDHHRYLEAQIAETREAVSRRAYRALPRGESSREGEPRVQVMSRALVDHIIRNDAGASDPRSTPIDATILVSHFTDARADRRLLLSELWAIKPLLKLSLLESLARSLHDDAVESPACERVARLTIGGLHALDELPWRELVESLSALDEVLRLDPGGVYSRMDFETRDQYRRAAERISKRSAISEEEVGRLAIELAASGSPETIDREATDHLGYYLLGDGVELLEKRAGYRPAPSNRFSKWAGRRMDLLYPSGVVMTTLAILAVLGQVLHPTSSPWWLLLAAVPASQAAIAIVNGIVHALVGPRRLPRMDFSEGLPDACRTFVVVPALLLSKEVVQRLVERLEVHYLANRDPNLRLALLTDGADAETEAVAADGLVDTCRCAIEALNQRYADADGRGPFYLFHRARCWNDHESVWMGHERKRGKLVDFNRFLLGIADAFSAKAGDLSAIGTIRYVITLDADTQLPLDAAHQLIGTAAHPLNHPTLDLKTNTVTHGYSILQPRIGISMASAQRSRLAGLHNTAAGLDPYTTAVSDLYQDLYGRGSFTGKGLYDLQVCHRAIGERFPDNSLLSHDLIEGEYAGTGLVTDVELIDDYPGSYDAYSKRKHRWIRGDWQLLPWLSRRVPTAGGARIENALGFVSRWKILDNLRRSLVEISTFGLLVYGWTQHRALAYFLASVLLLGAGVYTDLCLSVFRLPPWTLLRSFVRVKGAQIGRAHLETFSSLLLLPHQALVSADAIVRTGVRLFVTRRHLLEWESMAQADDSPERSWNLVRAYLLFTPVICGALLLALVLTGRATGVFPVLLTAAWFASPWFANWIDSRTVPSESLGANDVEFLRETAIRTWRFFAEWSKPQTSWLVPDNIDVESGHVAYRSSPTNVGLQLGATLAAHDFGYLTHQELAKHLGRVFETLGSLERYRGHFYNWFDIRTLQPLRPRYVSAVDSGNLCASLLTVSQGCSDVLKRALVEPAVWNGLRDHCAQLRKVLPAAVRQHSACTRLAQVLASECPGPNFQEWMRALEAMRPLVCSLRECLHRHGADGFTPNDDTEDAYYWATALTGRIDALLTTLRPFSLLLDEPVPALAEGGSSAALLQQIEQDAACSLPVNQLEDHYARLEQGLAAHIRSSSLPAPLAEAFTRLTGHVGRARRSAHELVATLQAVSRRASALATEADFRFLFDRRRKLLRVGYQVETSELDACCYGHLASEARTAVFFAIAKHDIPREAWFHLGRKLVVCGKHPTLLSWSGSMFEYAMPALFMKSDGNTLLSNSLRSAVRIQQQYAEQHRVPWGISEAAYSTTNDNMERRYQAFGVPGLAMKRLRGADLIVAPYATVLALTVDATAAIANLRRMALNGWIGRYGFFESIDYRRQEEQSRPAPDVVPLFMAHHQGMSLMALDHALFEGAMQRRFHADPLVLAAELLLHERAPQLIPESKQEAPTTVLAAHLRAAIPPSRAIAQAQVRGNADAPAHAMLSAS